MFWFVVSKAVCFPLSMSAPCFHVRKMWCTAEKRFMRHVCRRNPFLLFFLAKTFNSWRHQKSLRVNYWVASPARTSPLLDVWVVNQWWIRIIFRCTFSVPKICPRSIQATHACHSEVSNRCFWFVVSKAICFHLSMSAPCFHGIETKATKQ